MPVLDWIGKKAVVKHHTEVPFHLLQRLPELDVGDKYSGNLLIEGDNLIALKAILPHFAGKIKCIYIDPPYNTGNENWTYNDNVNSLEIQQWLGKVVGKEAEDLSRHDKWLCMIYPRLRLLKDFLTEDGAIFVSIDDNELQSLRFIMDEIFGLANFVATVVWQKSKKGDAKLISVCHEYVVVYAKNKARLKQLNTKWRRKKPGADEVLAHYAELRRIHADDHETISVAMKAWYRSLPAGHPAKAHKHYNKSDDRHLYFAADFAGPDDGRENRPRYDIIHPVTGQPCKKPSTGWRWEESKTLQALAEDPPRVHFGTDHTTIPCRKSYLIEIDQEPFNSVFYKDGRAGTLDLEAILGPGSFDFPKDAEILSDLIGLVAGPNDSVLDSFAGSGTTGQAVLRLNKMDGGNRNFILIELQPDICRNKTHKRLKNIIDGFVSQRGRSNSQAQLVSGQGGGFDYCVLGPSLFNAQGKIAVEVTFEDLARHVFFMETGCPWPGQEQSSPFLGAVNGLGIYLLYNGILKDVDPANGNVLTSALLAKLPPFNGAKTIFGTACLISQDRLRQQGITFRQIPYKVRVS